MALIRFLLDEPLLLVVMGYLVSVFFFRYGFNQGTIFAIGFCIVIILALLVDYKRGIIAVILITIGISLAFVNLNRVDGNYEASSSEFNNLLTTSGEIGVFIRSDPMVDHRSVRYPVYFRDGDRVIRFLIETNRYPTWSVGEYCMVPLDGVALKQLSDGYLSYLRISGDVGMVEVSDLKCIHVDDLPFYLGIREVVWQFKLRVTDIVDRSLVEPYAGLLLGMIFGDDRLFSEDFEEALRNSGTTHIVAASGFNISVIVFIVDAILGNLVKFKYRSFVTLVLVWLFAICADMSGSILRACIMTTILIVKRLLGRPTNLIEVLLVTVFIIVLINPLRVRDVGLLLSTGAVLGLYFVSPLISTLFSRLIVSIISLIKVKDQRKIVSKLDGLLEENLYGNISCNIGTIPISKGFFDGGSYLTILPNIFLIPMVELIYFLGVIFIFVKIVGFGWLGDQLKPSLVVLLTIFVFVIETGDQVIRNVTSKELVSEFSWIVSILIGSISIIFAYRRSRFNLKKVGGYVK